MKNINLTDINSKPVTIEKASLEDTEVAAVLTLMAYKDFAYDVFGTKNDEKVLYYFRELWKLDENRFSHKYSYIAKLDSKPVGLITCYPGVLVHKLITPTIKSIFKLGGLSFLWNVIIHINYFYYFAKTTEAYPDEFYIGTLAVLTEYRSCGIGAKMINFAVSQGKLHRLKKCTLLVDAKNTAGIRFYESNGYKKVIHGKKPREYFKVAKEF